ncbi:MAG: bifunctional tRNA (adenosine(37)-C2)-methyltransferase TrmG/ribosomal RNA large subunit methyltransferase RlmN, partial [Algicola sp.]|nr:bifunctional tRNA (adenosine(37)-C2)-methyltransferase TrmG/ribosomal RNA large subunit methyltransferase RlmN [Algicola sp.]
MSDNPAKINLLDLNQAKMKEFFESIDEKAFRVRQVMQWLYRFGVDDFDEMTNLNKVLREKLKRLCVI